MSFGLGLCHLGLLCLGPFDLVGHPLLCGRHRRLEVLAFALLMPVGPDDLLAAIVGLEGAMVDHAFEAVFLYLRALAVELGPLAHFDNGLELWRAPVYEELALFGYNTHKEARVVVCGGFPRSTLDLTAIVQSTRGCDLKTLEAMMLVVIEHAQQAPILLGKDHPHAQGFQH